MSGRGSSGNGSDKGGQRRTVSLDLSKHMDTEVHVKFSGGRQVRGVLKGWDPLVNLVLDDAVEEIRDSADPYRPSGRERKIGLVVARGTSVMTISPLRGMEEIQNPFRQQEGQI